MSLSHAGHDHSHSDHSENPQGSRAEAHRSISKAMMVTAVFMIVEIVGGLYSNSLALITDAGHMLTDLGAMALSLFAIWISDRPATRSMSFGWHRAEILGALASGLIIWLLAGLLVYEAVHRLSSPPPVQGPVMLAVAVIGLVANLAAMKLLHGSHAKNINAQAVYLHILTDLLGSVGVIIAGAIVTFTGWQPIDPIVTIVFAVLMLASSWKLVAEATSVLMESVPQGIDSQKIREDLQSIPGVSEVHDLHVWAVSRGKNALSVHLVSTGDHRKTLLEANQRLDEHHHIQHTTIQIEHPEHFVSSRCYDCAPASERG